MEVLQNAQTTGKATMFNIPEQVAQTLFVENDQYDADNKINNQLTLIFIC